MLLGALSMCSGGLIHGPLGPVPLIYAKGLAPATLAYAKYAPAAPVYPDAVPNYSFGYSVSDAHTGDAKSQHESRHGDVVKGSYSLVEPDGTTRTVQYTADAQNGFNAVVDRHPAAVHPASHPVPVKIAYALPPVAHAPLLQPHYTPFHG